MTSTPYVLNAISRANEGEYTISIASGEAHISNAGTGFYFEYDVSADGDDELAGGSGEEAEQRGHRTMDRRKHPSENPLFDT